MAELRQWFLRARRSGRHDGDGTPDTTFAAAVATAEAVRLDPAATRAQLEEQKNILERINGKSTMTVRSPRSRRGRGLRRVLAAMLLVVLAACDWQAATMPAPTPAADPLMDVARRDGTVVVMVQLAVEQGGDPQVYMRDVRRAQRKLMAELGPGAQAIERFKVGPQILLRVTPATLRNLRQSPLVVNISANSADAALE